MTVTLRPATIDLLDTEERGGLSEALGAIIPSGWPPEDNGPTYRDWQRRVLAALPHEPAYVGYYVIADGELVGTCGFKGPPDAGGAAEIGYSVIASHRRRGYATRAVTLLLDIAFADPRVGVVRAETLPDGLASQHVLGRCGFRAVGTRLDAHDGEVVCFARNRPG